MMESSKKSCNW